MPPVTTYATRADLANFGAAGAAVAAMDPSKQDSALAYASGLIDTYLTRHFHLPLLDAGRSLREPCVSISVWWLMTNEGYNPSATGDDSIEKRYLAAIRWLEKVAAGAITPDVTDSAPTGTTIRGPKVITSSQRGYSSRGDPNARGPFTGD
jgi:phage gp36-like protein